MHGKDVRELELTKGHNYQGTCVRINKGGEHGHCQQKTHALHTVFPSSSFRQRGVAVV